MSSNSFPASRLLHCAKDYHRKNRENHPINETNENNLQTIPHLLLPTTEYVKPNESVSEQNPQSESGAKDHLPVPNRGDNSWNTNGYRYFQYN